jgi:hypothetical protein
MVVVPDLAKSFFPWSASYAGSNKLMSTQVRVTNLTLNRQCYPSNSIPSQHWSLHGSEVPKKKEETACQVRSAVVVLQKIKRKTKKPKKKKRKKFRLGFNRMIDSKQPTPMTSC